MMTVNWHRNRTGLECNVGRSPNCHRPVSASVNSHQFSTNSAFNTSTARSIKAFAINSFPVSFARREMWWKLSLALQTLWLRHGFRVDSGRSFAELRAH